MADDREKNLKSIVNASGFVFQLSIMDNIQRTREKHNWDILAHEHPWRNHSNGDEGYIDIILKQKWRRLVIECKRTKDASWVFLNPDDKHDKVAPARCLWTDLNPLPHTVSIDIKKGTSEPVYEIISGWYDFAMAPTSPESEFCAIRGSGEKDKPFLERICGELLRAIDCLSVEEKEIEKKKKYHRPYMYIPTIVTNAQLELCHFDPEKVSLSDGLLKDGKFETVPFIRFRKSLTTILSSYAPLTNLMDANKDKQRTILIINADSFCDVLENIQVEKGEDMDPWPWESHFRRSS